MNFKLGKEEPYSVMSHFVESTSEEEEGLLQPSEAGVEGIFKSTAVSFIPEGKYQMIKRMQKT